MTGIVRIGIVGGSLIGLLLAVFGCQSKSRPTPVAPAEPTTPVQTSQAQGGESKPAVDLTLRFTPGSNGVFRSVVEQGKSVTWQGAQEAKPKGFEDGYTDNRTELTFEQKVLSVDPAGDAVIQITIQAVKFVNRVHNKVGVDFDSTRPADQNNPLAVLVGQSYQIKLSRRGEVPVIVEAAQARAAVAAGSDASQVAQRMLSDDEIRERHAIVALSALEGGRASPGQSWSSEKSFSFSWMGTKAFERIYTLAGISEKGPEQSAVIEMKAIPAAGQAPQGLQAMGPFASAFDTSSNYDGRCVLDPVNGRVRESTEQMHSEWVMMDPAAAQNNSAAGAVKMAASWTRRLELVK